MEHTYYLPWPVSKLSKELVVVSVANWKIDLIQPRKTEIANISDLLLSMALLLLRNLEREKSLPTIHVGSLRELFYKKVNKG